MKNNSKKILLLSLVSRDWQVDRILLIKEKLKKKSFKSETFFLCTDKFSNGNSKNHLNKLNVKTFTLLPEIEIFNYQNYVTSTQFILNSIEEYKNNPKKAEVYWQRMLINAKTEIYK